MRTPTISSIAYTPGEPPTDAAEMRRFVLDELNKIAAAVSLLAAGHLDVSYAAPAKPRNGDIRYADGTTWNPGAGGQGIYAYYNSTWNKLG